MKQMTLRQILQSWFNTTRSKVHIRHVIPVIVCWAIWELRNKDKHRERTGDAKDIINRVSNFVTRLGNAGLFSYKHWKGDYKLAEYFECYDIRKEGAPMYLQWVKPPPSKSKLNIDGAANPTFRTASGGGIVRNDRGELIWGFGRYYGGHTALYAETMALLDGLKLCCGKKMEQFEVETNSMLLFKMVADNEGPWHFKDLITHIRKLLNICKAEFRQVYREQNQVADFIAKSVMTTREDIDINPQNATRKLTARVDLESIGLGNFRL